MAKMIETEPEITDDFVLKAKEIKTVDVEDGYHTGIITKLEKRDLGEYTYLDIWIELDEETNKDGSSINLKYGCPYTISEKSKLGKLIEKMTGKKIIPNQNYNIVELLQGRKVGFVTMKGDKYVEISDNSVRPSQ